VALTRRHLPLPARIWTAFNPAKRFAPGIRRLRVSLRPRADVLEANDLFLADFAPSRGRG